MVQETTIIELKELYLDTIQRCGTFLLKEVDEVIEYEIFEEFDIGMISFLHEDSLTKLFKAGLISKDIMTKSSELRRRAFEIQEIDKWSMEEFKKSNEWKYLLELADEINILIKSGYEN